LCIEFLSSLVTLFKSGELVSVNKVINILQKLVRVVIKLIEVFNLSLDVVEHLQ
jgi:hypothetical protein